MVAVSLCVTVHTPLCVSSYSNSRSNTGIVVDYVYQVPFVTEIKAMMLYIIIIYLQNMGALIIFKKKQD